MNANTKHTPTPAEVLARAQVFGLEELARTHLNNPAARAYYWTAEDDAAREFQDAIHADGVSLGEEQVARERYVLTTYNAMLVALSLCEATHIVRAVNSHAELVAALRECEDYFDQRADADCTGDPPRFVGNHAMTMLGVVREALAKAEGGQP